MNKDLWTPLFQAIIKYVTSRGFPLESYEIVTNFPRRILTDLDETKTLKELGLFPQETVFVQKRWNKCNVSRYHLWLPPSYQIRCIHIIYQGVFQIWSIYFTKHLLVCLFTQNLSKYSSIFVDFIRVEMRRSVVIVLMITENSNPYPKLGSVVQFSIKNPT